MITTKEMIEFCDNGAIHCSYTSVDPEGAAMFQAIRDFITANNREGWVKITSIRDMPKKKTSSYEQYDCLVFHKGEILHLVWNCEHLVWDDPDGDDYFCDPLVPTHYWLFPSTPQPEDDQS